VSIGVTCGSTKTISLLISGLASASERLDKHLCVSILPESRRVLFAVRALSSHDTGPKFPEEFKLKLLHDRSLRRAQLFGLTVLLELLELAQNIVFKLFTFNIEPTCKMVQFLLDRAVTCASTAVAT